MAKYLGIVELGTLRKNSVEIPLVTKPWRTDSEPYVGAGTGNTPIFDATAGMAAYSIGDTSTTPANKLKWHRIQDGNKLLLIADRNILNTVSWDDLNAQGYVVGKNIVIDGVTYKCRLLTGGNNYRTGTDAYSGGTLGNEWDRFISREDETLTGLEAPITSDLDTTLNSTDLNSVHNKLWNWMGIRSWCQEVYTGNASYRAYRGYHSARYYDSYASSDRRAVCGWRPVLEVLSAVPEISGVDENFGLLEADKKILYTVTDADVGDVVSVNVKLDGTIVDTKPTIILGTQYEYNVIINDIAAGSHTLTIEATDSKGVSSTRTYTFTKPYPPSTGSTYLGVVELGTLRKNGVEILLATKPWRTDSEPYTGAGVGNIPVFDNVAGMTAYSIGDTSATVGNKLKWHKIKDGDKTLLIADRNILGSISWDDLNAHGYVAGKTISIDGVTYKCRLLSGGSNYRTGTDNYSGGTLGNEWDRFITKEETTLTNLSSPIASDLDNTLNATDLNSVHNKLWNWMGMWSWCQEVYTGNASFRALRGGSSARYYGYGTSSTRSAGYGWRPVLEVLSAVPEISGVDENFGLLEADKKILYTVTDADVGDVVSVNVKLDGTIVDTKPNIFLGRQYEYDIIYKDLTVGNHTLVVEAVDYYGASAQRTYTFSKAYPLPENAEYEGLVELGSLLHNGIELPLATKPWRTDSEPYVGAGVGDIPIFDGTMSNYTIGDTSSTVGNKLKWHKIKNGKKTLLIADRNILGSVSWDDLNSMGYVAGKKITIDGKDYKCRLLSGGSDVRTSGDWYSGGILGNEWDRFISREDGLLTGLASPIASDLDNTLNATDLNSVHNKLWNWMGIYSWCQEVYTGNASSRANRGSNSARNYGYSTSSNRTANSGWRPVLEVLSAAPEISGVDENFGLLEADKKILYTVTDTDVNDVVGVNVKLDGAVVDSNPNITLGVQYEYDIIVKSLTTGSHILTIEASDIHGNITVRTFDFIISTTPYTITLDKPITISNVESLNLVKINPTLNSKKMKLSNITEEKMVFTSADVNSPNIKLDINGRDTKIEKIIYIIS